MAEITQQIFSSTPASNELWILPAATPQGTLVVQQGRVGITSTDTLGVSKPNYVVGTYTISGIKAPGASLEDVQNVPKNSYAVIVYTDGDFEFKGVKVTVAGGVDAPTTTTGNTPVFVTTGGVLTLESAGNTKVGVVHYPPTYTKAAGKLPIKIGV